MSSIELSNVNIQTSTINALNYIAIGILSIIFGFVASGRDGLMYDTRIVRGFHRVEWPVLIHIFGIYSIILSLSQWSIDNDNRYCNMSYDNTSSVKTLIKDNCSAIVDSTDVLWIIILILDSLYITSFLWQRDFRTAETNKERINVRLIQKHQFRISFIFNILRIAIHLSRCVIIIIISNITSIVLSGIALLIALFMSFVHIRVLNLIEYNIHTYTKLDINDLTESDNKNHKQLPGPITSSDDDHDFENPPSPPPKATQKTSSSNSKSRPRPKNGIVF